MFREVIGIDASLALDHCAVLLADWYAAELGIFFRLGFRVLPERGLGVAPDRCACAFPG